MPKGTRIVGRSPTSVIGRLRNWFAENRDEQLTVADAMVKFDAKEVTVRESLRRLMAEGSVESSHVYQARQWAPEDAAK